MRRGLCLPKTPFLLPALMFRQSVDRLLADDVHPRLAAADRTRLCALARRAATRGARIAVAPLLPKPGSYNALLVRRGDFLIQRPHCRISGTEITANVRRRVLANRPLYVATNETDRTFFAPLAKHYDLRFFSDIADRDAYCP